MSENQRQLIEDVRNVLRDAAGRNVEPLKPPHDSGIDLLLKSGDYIFLVVSRQSSSASPVYMAVQSLRSTEGELRQRLQAASSTIMVPVLVVPFMGKAGRQVCEEEGLAWLDRSGNADIRAKGLRVLIRGQKNRFRERGRKANPFSPQASRLTRQFLLHDNHSYTQKELVEETGLDQGFVSRILRRMVEQNLVVRRARRYEVTNRTLLLKAWQEAYDFTKHQIVKGHIAARSSDNLVSLLSTAFQNEGLTSAATGLAGAWLLTHFASFRLVTFYVDYEPPDQFLTKIGFRHEERGANTWLVIPNDKGVFFGRHERDGICTVHPVQVYLDLEFHPERSNEAAERIRELYLQGESHA